MKAGQKKLSATPVDPYQEFLAEQKKREAQWCEETKAKKARNEEKEAKSFSAGATAEDVASIKLLLQESICKVSITTMRYLLRKCRLESPFQFFFSEFNTLNYVTDTQCQQ